MTVVFDSNIWISAFRFGGEPMRALDVSYRRDIVACCKEIEVEVERNLFNKFGTPRHRTASLMNRWLLEGIRIESRAH